MHAIFRPLRAALVLAFAFATLPATAFAQSAAPAMAPAAGAATMPTCATGDAVVWVNTKSKVYHYSGDKYYGKTKAGKYLCESAAKTAGDHAVKPHSMGKSMKMEHGSMSGGTMSGGTMAAPSGATATSKP